MKNPLLNAFAIVCIVLFLSACSTTKHSLYNTRWELGEVQGVVIDYMVNPKAEIYLVFDETKKQFYGSTGCNKVGGKLTVEEGNKIKLSEFYSTKMACEKMRAERLYLSLLESADNYKFSGSTLTLYQGTNQVASYTKSKLPVPTGLAVPTN
ncbi:hypothetical protein C3K47_00595 [Solitalea longa]|uniref:DUF306 domain-containing protein n=1 Tax=Solitalea longa TaxID=2079460 RepID=A0A2S5A9I1_9SPHI|nr:META domain-containing protein [Solitalea longa]POY39032.1 hypothetical protein C3K47_00595 [Solitalea longa]